MRPFADHVRRWLSAKHVRPWALSAPVAVLVICLPLLLLARLRHPIPSELLASMSDEETARWGTVQALVEQQTFAIDGTMFAATRQRVAVGYPTVHYANQPPAQGLLLAGPYWVLNRAFGLRFRDDPGRVTFLLTLVAVTVPVAAAAGMIYRMGRMFELPRPWRAGLALAVVTGSGLLSYATVLNPFAPAASLVLVGAAILVQVSRIRSPFRSGGYLASAGFFTALAAVVHPAASPFLVLFAGVIAVMRWRPSVRFGGVLMYGLGAIPPILLHVSLSLPITGNWSLGLTPIAPPPPAMRLARVPAGPGAPAHLRVVPAAKPVVVDDDGRIVEIPSAWQAIGLFAGRLTGAMVGRHGLLVHFPVLVFGAAGLWIVVRRNWPGPTKGLAVATLVGGAVVLLRYVVVQVDWRFAMYGVRWYVVFLPLVLFWAGAWCRRPHHVATWATAATLLAFSCVVSLIGATDPTPPNGYDRYTPVAALRRLTAPTDSAVLAGR